MEMIYSQPGVDYIAQPLDLWNYHPHFRKIPLPYQNRYINIKSEIENQMLFKYFQNLTKGHIRLRHQWNIFNRNFNWYINRLVFKELNAKTFNGLVYKKF